MIWNSEKKIVKIWIYLEISTNYLTILRLKSFNNLTYLSVYDILFILYTF